MKKLIAILSMLFLLPMSTFALTMMEDSQMNDITAQAGVTIGLDVNVGMHVDTVAWGDTDGVDMQVLVDHDGDPATPEVPVTVSQGGWVGVSDMNADLWVGLREDINNLSHATYTFADAQFLTIDVDTIAGVYNDASFVRIGLGTLEISGDMNMDFELGASRALGQELGTLDINGMTVRLDKDGFLDITTMGRPSGVTLSLGVLMDEINIDSLAWGDTDGMMHVFGVAAGSAAGYVGLTALDIDDLAISGVVGIDVLTLDAAAMLTNTLNPLAETYHGQLLMHKVSNVMSAAPGQISDTMVVLSLGNVDGSTDAAAGDIYINMATMEATASIGAASDLAVAGELGQIFIGGAQVTVDGLVAIGAH